MTIRASICDCAPGHEAQPEPGQQAAAFRIESLSDDCSRQVRRQILDAGGAAPVHGDRNAGLDPTPGWGKGRGGRCSELLLSLASA